MSDEFLSLSHIGKSFAGVRALQDVSLTLHQGQVYCLVGENGSGKSTLIKIIAGVHAPDTGEIVINGKPYKRLHPIESIREGIEVIYQDFSLFLNLTVAENLALNEQISRNRRLVNWKEVYQIAHTALGKINISLDLDKPVSELSIADRQLIAIARALLQNAQLIIMDEPTTALTQKEVRALFSVIKNLKQNGISVLFVSHKLDEVLEIADRIVIIRNGSKVVDEPANALDRTNLVRHMVGRDITYEHNSDEAPADAPVLLRVDRLSSARNFSDVSFELKAGEILGISGLLGSGRSALALSLFGMLPADSGQVYLAGKPVRLESVELAIQHGIGYVPEDRLNEGLFLPQSIGTNLMVRIIDRLLTPFWLIDHPALERKIREWLKQLKIKTPSPDLPVTSLSGGNQQRVVLAKWLASAPKILILNGPTVGVDVGSKAEIHEIIRNLAVKGMGLIVISDDVPELLQVCQRIMLMKKGKIVHDLIRHKITEAQLNTMLTTV